jgi:putative hydrolase of the HAD superfamily
MVKDFTNQVLTDPSAGPFAHVRTWVFDLDNTLYPVTKQLLAHIDKHMGNFVANFLNVDATEARQIQKTYFRKYGLTLRGLMLHHGLDPVRYYDEMTPMDLTQVDPNPALATALRALNGRKVIYTNASAHHAEIVLDRLGMSDVFEGIYDITAAEYVPKPAIDSYRKLCELHNIDPAEAAMVDDIARNLEAAATLGMKTVWMRTGAEWAEDVEPEPYIDHITSDILDFVRGIGGSAV